MTASITLEKVILRRRQCHWSYDR